MNELLNNVHSNSPSTKDEDEDNDDDEEDDADENEAVSGKSQSSDINPERLKAFNVSIHIFSFVYFQFANLNYFEIFSSDPNQSA